MSMIQVGDERPQMSFKELGVMLGSRSNDELIRLSRSIPFTVKLDIYGMHALATVLATRLELADEQLDYASEWRAETPLDGLAAENAREKPQYISMQVDGAWVPCYATPKAPELAERAADWQVP